MIFWHGISWYTLEQMQQCVFILTTQAWNLCLWLLQTAVSLGETKKGLIVFLCVLTTQTYSIKSLNIWNKSKYSSQQIYIFSELIVQLFCSKHSLTKKNLWTTTLLRHFINKKCVASIIRNIINYDKNNGFTYDRIMLLLSNHLYRPVRVKGITLKNNVYIDCSRSEISWEHFSSCSTLTMTPKVIKNILYAGAVLKVYLIMIMPFYVFLHFWPSLCSFFVI